MTKKADIGMLGLAVMGRSLSLNINDHGYSMAVYSIDPAEVERFMAAEGRARDIIGTTELTEFVGALKRPRRIWMMIRAGSPVDEMITKLIPLLDEGDIIIDGGNSNYHDTIRRVALLESKGLRFIGTGVSGGEEGARHGPALMPGGTPAAWPHLEPVFSNIAAKLPDGTPCSDWVGQSGAGHYVKMVHNGIEYSDMQMIAESYAMMKHMLGMSPAEMQPVFKAWNEGELNSYLIEITRDIMAYVDAETGNPLVEMILDTAGQKGTGKWTSRSALDVGAPAPTIAEAVFARFMSAVKSERVAAAQVLSGPDTPFPGNKTAMIEDIRQALYASKICSYAQGFQLLRYAATEYGWDLNYGGIAGIWRGGCIIRAGFLYNIKEAFDENADLSNLLLHPFFKEAVERSQAAWRRVVAAAVTHGVPVPSMSSALAYFDSYRHDRLPANVLQAQRDYFGAHTYERIDKPRGQFFHTDWTGHGGNVSATTYTA